MSLQRAGDEVQLSENINYSDDSKRPQKVPVSQATLLLPRSETGIEMIIELPRDILTGYILCRLTGVWEKHTYKGKCGIYGALILSYLVQFSIFVSLTSNIDYSTLQVPMTGTEWWHNLVAIVILFMYLWKDLVSFHSSVWFWIGRVEKTTALAMKFISASKKARNKAVSGVNALTTKIQNIRILSNVESPITVNDDEEIINSETSGIINRETILEGVRFFEFRVWLVSVYVLYFGFAAYSLIQIGASELLIDKISVSLNIFFVLEIDNWANELFIMQTGVLDDVNFDVVVFIDDETEEDKLKRVETRIIRVMLLLTLSVLGVWILSNYRGYFDNL